MISYKPILSNRLWVKKERLTALSDLREELTVRSIYDDVSAIKTYKEDDEWFGIPRNYYSTLPEYIDKRVTGNTVNIEFNGELRQQQQHVIEQWQELYNKEVTDTIINTDTGSGKTILALKIASILKVPFLVIVPREGLLGQWATRILEFTNIKNGQIGYCQQTRCEYQSKLATIGMVHSICKDMYSEAFKNYYGLVIVDELDKVGATTFSAIAGMFPAKYKCGLTATLDRADKRENAYFYHFSQNIITTKKSYQPKPKVALYRTNCWSGKIPYWCRKSIQRRAWVISNLAANTERNELLAHFANILVQKGLRTLVIGDRIAQLEQIEKILFHKYDIGGVGLYISNTKPRKKEWLLNDANCILATTKMLDVGMDSDTLRGLVFATPTSDVRQIVGRIRRENDALPDPIVVDLVDMKYGNCTGWAKKRLQWYQEAGFEVTEVNE